MININNRFRTIARRPVSVRLYDDQMRAVEEIQQRHGDDDMSETLRYVVDAYMVYTNQKTIDEEMVNNAIRNKNQGNE